MSTVTYKKQSAASVSNADPGCLKSFVDTADSILKTKDENGVVRPSGVGTADELATSGAPVDISASAPPTAGQALLANSPTDATWQDLPTGYTQTAVQTGPTYSAAVGERVRVDVSGGNVTVNLPAGHAAEDKIFIKLVSAASPGTNECVVDADGTETIDGQLTTTMDIGYEWAEFCSDGTNWMQVG